MAIQLKNANITDFLILEKAQDVGGTWRQNSYPGAECDIPSALYSFSFEHNAEWHYKWSEQPQILAYQQQVANKHGLYQHIRFGQEVRAARFDEQQRQWVVSTHQGDTYHAQHLVSAVGQLHHPYIPTFAGQDTFSGACFHSANWNHDVDLNGKRVAVIGNAASALQFIPEIAKQASTLTVFQRSPNWVLPKQDRPYKSWENRLMGKFGWIQKLYRLKVWLRGELLLFRMMTGNRLTRWWGERECRNYLQRAIDDPALRARLIPDYPIGAKRILLSDDYYDALNRSNVELVTSGISKLTETGITHGDGRHEDYDAIIYGTGFRTNPFLSQIDIHGRQGRLLRDSWSDGAHAYYGIATSGFPNLFMMYGPNTNLGHNSIIVMIECQARYIVQCVRKIDRENWREIEVRPQVEETYNQQLQQRLAQTVWTQAAVSWYKDGDKITNNWAGTSYEYIRRTRQVDWSSYTFA